MLLYDWSSALSNNSDYSKWVHIYDPLCTCTLYLHTKWLHKSTLYLQMYIYTSCSNYTVHVTLVHPFPWTNIPVHVQMYMQTNPNIPLHKHFFACKKQWVIGVQHQMNNFPATCVYHGEKAKFRWDDDDVPLCTKTNVLSWIFTVLVRPVVPLRQIILILSQSVFALTP